MTSILTGHNPAHPIGTCGHCGEEMCYNVPRLGPNGGYVHKGTGRVECFPEIKIGKGWRELEAGETIQVGDQYYFCADGYKKREKLWWDYESEIGKVYIADQFPSRRRIEQPAPVAPAVENDTLLPPCPFCNQTPALRDDYDRYSGCGQKENGWVECRCGASIFKPTPTEPYPKRAKADAVAAWNLRANSLATGTEAEVCADIAKRQQMGIKKYGTTLVDSGLNADQLLQHSYEETLDLCIYLKAEILARKSRTPN